MQLVTLIGLIAAVCTTSSFLPQVIKSWRTKDTRAISLPMYSLLVFGTILWLTYGIFINEVPIILANGVTLLLSASILFLKLKYG
ncbi:MAG: SemiSWEET transporter [Nanoarchaeota archaeon]